MNSTLEWSLEFDQMWNNITSNQAPGLTEHEKSIFLTRAQEGLILDFFSRRTDPLGLGFDGNEIRQSDFHNLIVTFSSQVPTSVTFGGNAPAGVSNQSSFFLTMPDDILVILNEEILSSGSGTLQVKPLSYKEYERLMSRPYKYPPKGQAWRLDVGMAPVVTTSTTPETKRIVEIITRISSNMSYYLRYVKNPDPIILPDVQGDTNVSHENTLPVNGSIVPATCKLPSHLHQQILNRAVMLAKVAWSDPAALQQRTNG